MYEAVRIERMKTLQDAINRHPLLPDVSAGGDVTLKQKATDGPFAIFIHAVDGKITEFTMEDRPAEIVFEAPMEVWKKLVAGQPMDFVNSLMNRELKLSVTMSLDKAPTALAKILRGAKTSFSFYNPELRVNMVARMYGDSYDLTLGEFREGEKSAEHAFEVPIEYMKKLLWGEIENITWDILLRRIKYKGGIVGTLKLLKLTKLSKAFGHMKFIRLFAEFVRWDPVTGMA